MARIDGIDKVKAAIKAKAAKYAAGVERGLIKGGLFLLRESMDLVPIDTGALRASGPPSTGPKGHGFATVMTVGYGQNYALFVHEDLTVDHTAHDWHSPDRGAKYLEGPLNLHRKRIIKIIIDESKK